MQLRFLDILWRLLRLVTERFDHKSLVLLVVQIRVVFGWRWKGFVEPLQRKGAHVPRQEVFDCMPPGASCPSMLHLPPPCWSCRSNGRRSLRFQPIMMGNFCSSKAWISRRFSLDFLFKRSGEDVCLSIHHVVPVIRRGHCAVLTWC